MHPLRKTIYADLNAHWKRLKKRKDRLGFLPDEKQKLMRNTKQKFCKIYRDHIFGCNEILPEFDYTINENRGDLVESCKGFEGYPGEPETLSPGH